MSDTQKTPTQVLIDCIDLFGTYEPDHVILVFTDIEGGITIKGNVRRTEAIGMLEIGKQMVMDHPDKG